VARVEPKRNNTPPPGSPNDLFLGRRKILHLEKPGEGKRREKRKRKRDDDR